MKEIDALRHKAAEMTYTNPECDNLFFSELSDSRSAAPDRIVIHLQCENGARFYLSKDEILAGASAVSQQSQTVGYSDDQMMQECVEAIRQSLHFPSSMSQHWTGSEVYRAPTGNVAVSFGFDAKNALGNEVPYTGRCVFDDRGMHPPELTPR